MATVYLYSNTKDNNVVTKRPTFLTSFSCDLMGGTDVLHPILIISNDKVLNFLNTNYCYIDVFKRYYDCTFTVLDDHMVRVNCNVDYLGSFDQYIRALQALVVRNEFKYNDYIEDGYVISRVGTVTQKQKIGSIGYEQNYVLTVSGGGE